MKGNANCLSVMILVTTLLFSGCAPVPTRAPETDSITKGAIPSPEGLKAAWEEEWGNTLAQAKKEGEVRILSTHNATARAALATGFKDKYGIDVDSLGGGGTELSQRVLSERRAGLYIWDIAMMGTSSLLNLLKSNGLLQPLDPVLVLPEVLDDKVWKDGKIPFLDRDRTTIGMLTQYTRYMVRNTDMVKEGEITSYRDILKPQWKGKIVVGDPTISGTGNTWVALLTRIWGLEETKKYLRELALMEPIVTRDRRLLIEWVAKGKYPVGVASNSGETAILMDMGAPIAWISAKEGGLISSGSNSLSLLTKPAHPHAAKVFVNWLLSRNGQMVLMQGDLFPPVRIDVPTDRVPAAQFAQPNEKFYWDDEETIRAKAEMIQVANEIFASLVR